MEEKDMYLVCGCCGTRINLGESFRHDKNYNAYCSNQECSDGITSWGAYLESCWFG